jgi:hypothetical protein
MFIPYYDKRYIPDSLYDVLYDILLKRIVTIITYKTWLFT